MTQIQLPDDTTLRARLRDFHDDYAYCLDEDRL